MMIQERRGMLKVWNVFLICLTFFMTIFGTFLTRSGLIASVHSFAHSEHRHLLRLVHGRPGAWSASALIVWRLPLLRAENRIDSLLSAASSCSCCNNWVLLGHDVLRADRHHVPADQRVRCAARR